MLKLPFRSFYFPLAMFLLIGAVGCENTTLTANPKLEVEPAEFTFAGVGVGDSARRFVTLSNSGSAPLRMSGFVLVSESEDEFILSQIVDQNHEDLDASAVIVLNPGQSHGLAVEYTRHREIALNGVVRFETNDVNSGNANVEVPVTVTARSAEIRVPASLDFGQVEVNDESSQNLTVTNAGTSDLNIGQIRIDGRQSEFTVETNGTLVGREELEEPIVIPAGQTLDFSVTFAPTQRGPLNNDQLVIESDARNSASIAVTLLGNGAAPCLLVIPEVIDYAGGMLVDSLEDETPNVRPLIFESCGNAAVRVDRIEIQGGEGAFKVIDLAEAGEDGALYRLPATAPGEDSPREALDVGFWPTELKAYGAQMLVHSNDPLSPMAIDLFGRGVDNQCPVPIAEQEVFDVAPLDIVTLDGSPSTDPGGSVVAWHWTIVERPDGSTSVPVESLTDPRSPADGGEDDDTSTPEAVFFVDLAGRYRAELRVVDNLGQESCAPPVAEVTINALPDKDLHIQLVWSTPADRDESDEFGTDVDLHFTHERANGGWGPAAGDFDCYFDNTAPEWGVPGPQDNPTLDIDDTNGAGPENVNLAEPELDSTYDIGAIYFRTQSTFGDADADRRLEHASYVTVRLYARGELLLEFLGKEMTRLRELWHVASVTWCEDAEDLIRCPEISQQDRLYAEGEYRSQGQ